MPLVELAPPPGVFRNGTELESKGRWYETNLVRWHEGTLRPIKGWRQRGSGTFTGIARGAIAWTDNSGNRWVAFGTASKLYVTNSAGDTFDITPAGFTTGNEDAPNSSGFGYGLYGDSQYGNERPDTGAAFPEATTWSLDTFGQFLVACSTDDGKLYEWQLNTGTPAAAITNAPTSNASLVVTNERALMAFGAGGDPRKIQWSNLESNTSWTPAATNQAGSFILSDSGRIMRALRLKQEILILTDKDAHLGFYEGLPLVYRFEKLGPGGLAAPGALVDAEDFAAWMGPNGFFLYNGRLEKIPCDVSDYVFGDINSAQISKVSGWHNTEFNEIWWHYPSSGTTECDRYVVWNYRENIWYFGDMDRTCGIPKGTFRYPILLGTDGKVYDHEVAFNYGSDSPYAETAPFEIGVGDRFARVTRLLSDENTLGDVSVTFYTRQFPTGTESTFGPYTPTEPLPLRFSGRQVKMRATGSSLNSWRLGNMKLEVQAGGKR